MNNSNTNTNPKYVLEVCYICELNRARTYHTLQHKNKEGAYIDAAIKATRMGDSVYSYSVLERITDGDADGADYRIIATVFPRLSEQDYIYTKLKSDLTIRLRVR